MAAGVAVLLTAACAPARPVPPAMPDTGPAGHAGHGVATGQRALAERQAEFLAAMAARDADRMAALFAEDAVMHVANMPPIQGRAAIGRFYGYLFGFLSASTATPAELRVSAGGDMAYGTGATTNEFRGPDGPVSYAGKYVMVWRNVAGEWLVALYGVSSNQPEAT